MAAKELMHNDLALLNGKIIRFDTYCGFVRLEDGAQFPRSIKVQPIPLTPEILEKNGWKHDKKLSHWWYPNVGFVIWYNLMTFQDFYCCEITSMKFDYVHQLQHALRLCGLADLADNFKVD